MKYILLDGHYSIHGDKGKIQFETSRNIFNTGIREESKYNQANLDSVRNKKNGGAQKYLRSYRAMYVRGTPVGFLYRWRLLYCNHKNE